MRIPVYDSPQVNSAPLPGVEINNTSGINALEQSQERLGQSISQTGETLGKAGLNALVMADQAKRQAAQAAAMTAANNWDTDVQSTLSGVPSTRSQAAGDAAFDGTDNAPPAPPGFTASGPPLQSNVGAGGFFNQRGSNAVTASEPARTYLDQSRERYAAGIADPQTRYYFAQLTQPKLQAYHRQIEDHTTREFQAFQAQTLKNSAANSFTASNTAVENALNPDGSPNIERAEQDVDAQAKPVLAAMDAALPPEVATAQKATYLQQLHSGVVEHYLDAKKDWRSAEAWLDAHEKEIGFGAGGEQRVNELRKSVEFLKGDQEGEETARALVNGSVVGDSGLTDIAKADSGFRALPGPANKRSEQAFSKYRGLAEDQNRQVVANHFNAAFSSFLQGGHSLSAVAPTEKTWLQTYDPEGWHRLEQTQTQWQAEQQRRGSPKSPYADGFSMNYARMIGDITTNWGPDWQNMKFDQYARSFGSALRREDFVAGWKAISERQAAAGKPNAESVGLGDKVAMGMLVDAGLLPTSRGGEPVGDPLKLGGDVALAFTKMHDEASNFRLQFKAQHGGKEPGAQDYQQHLAPMVQKVPVKGAGFLGLFDEDVPRVQVETSPTYKNATVSPQQGEQPQGQGKPPAIPTEELPQILGAFKKAGIPDPTPDEVQEMYARAHGGQAPTAASAVPQHLQYDPPPAQRVLGSVPPGAPGGPPSSKPKTIVLPEVVLDGKPAKPPVIHLPEVVLPAAKGGAPGAKGKSAKSAKAPKEDLSDSALEADLSSVIDQGKGQ